MTVPSRGAPAFTLRDFVRESNRIEGIHRDPYPQEVAAHTKLVNVAILSVKDIERFVRSVTRGADSWEHPWRLTGAPLREREGMDVVVGLHRPPRGGPRIREQLTTLLNSDLDPYEFHCEYEKLHPFMDGNGRSGRALWLRHRRGIQHAPLGFLHHFYYEALNEYRSRAPSQRSGE